MIIPDKVKIGGVSLEVRRGVERLKMGPGYSANFIPAKGLIETSAGLAGDVEERDFLHEVVHALFWNLGDEEHRNDEVHVDKIAGALYALVKDNPGMLG